MIWLTERQSRYLMPVTMPDGYDAERRTAKNPRLMTLPSVRSPHESPSTRVDPSRAVNKPDPPVVMAV